MIYRTGGGLLTWQAVYQLPLPVDLPGLSWNGHMTLTDRNDVIVAKFNIFARSNEVPRSNEAPLWWISFLREKALGKGLGYFNDDVLSGLNEYNLTHHSDFGTGDITLYGQPSSLLMFILRWTK
jgi:hypothetical protein